MAAGGAACKRAAQLGIATVARKRGGCHNYVSAPCLETTRDSPSRSWNRIDPLGGSFLSTRHHISQVVKSDAKRLFLVDTLALVRRLEGQGVQSNQAEAITAAITEVLNDSLENMAQSVVPKSEMQKEHHFSLMQHENEKLQSEIETVRSELRHEIDKVTAGQRLDLNLERGRIRDELADQNAETCNLTNKMDREIHALRAQLEAAKYDVIKNCIGTSVSISAVGLAVVRVLM